MQWHDNTPYDFALVSTYLPFVVLIARGSVYVVAIYWLSSLTLSIQGLAMITVSAVYVDCLCMHEHSFDRACGHVCVCAVAVLLQMQAHAQCTNAQLMFVTSIDLLWSASAGVEVILRSTHAKMPTQQVLKTVLCCVFASMRVSMGCYELGTMDALLRTVLYYVLCAMLLLCSAFLPQHERQMHVTTMLYICTHVLFVHLYAVMASIAVMLAVHVRLVYLHVAKNSGVQHIYDTKPEPPGAQQQSNKDYNDLILKLQAAKRASNMA